MSSAGQQLTANRIPGERITETEEVADSSTFTTSETEVISVTAALVVGRRYAITGRIGFMSTVSGDTVTCRLREDNTSGTQLDMAEVEISRGNLTTVKYVAIVYAEFTAGSTGNQEFICSGTRTGGSGTCRMEADTTRPSYLTVDYIRG